MVGFTVGKGQGASFDWMRLDPTEFNCFPETQAW